MVQTAKHMGQEVSTLKAWLVSFLDQVVLGGVIFFCIGVSGSFPISTMALVLAGIFATTILLLAEVWTLAHRGVTIGLFIAGLCVKPDPGERLDLFGEYFMLFWTTTLLLPLLLVAEKLFPKLVLDDGTGVFVNSELRTSGKRAGRAMAALIVIALWSPFVVNVLG